ncbi:Zn-ribbon domain-containing OB-fold protein [Halobacterium salinarum]|uniref:Zn-ribbon domain-containing OB-fold protein n=1 Tax=Halobacterium salinarum TaxID=2242 RepID=UPI001F203828|nr:OB-fold domain-containing protein [Halobacterium salinarum]MCF2206691.1 OB-fold domain-containing protein [Halobacterium salinarum]MCF2242187.1 OB-fold domain-containing protein [Halobacterium salinarum]MDL0128351.1 OB-fold domain-containing protein [Halobacterium salinarum]MDL0134610.1 OB-fold domain-containing protein [Halobacterium salinarum]
MSDDHDSTEPGLDAHRCENGHLSHPGHARCPDCGAPQTETVDLAERTGEVVTWTTSTATPPGVREPNHLAIVEFEVDGEAVRALGQLTTADGIEIGAAVDPVYCAELRAPDAGIREPESQRWDGYRFEPA